MNKKSNGLMLGSFAMFFALLLAERLISIILCFKDPALGFKTMFMGAKYNLYIYGLTVLCIAAFAIMFAFTLGRALALGVERTYKLLVLCSVCLLIPAMLRTEHSITIIQYVSFGFLSLALLFRYFVIRKERVLNIGYTITSWIYVSTFVLTIPVVIKTIAGNGNLPLYLALGVGSIAAIFVYMILLFKLFSDKYKTAVNPFFLLATIAINAAGVAFAIGTDDFTHFIVPLITLGVCVVAYAVNFFVALSLKRRLRRA